MLEEVANSGGNDTELKSPQLCATIEIRENAQEIVWD